MRILYSFRKSWENNNFEMLFLNCIVKREWQIILGQFFFQKKDLYIGTERVIYNFLQMKLPTIFFFKKSYRLTFELDKALNY